MLSKTEACNDTHQQNSMVSTVIIPIEELIFYVEFKIAAEFCHNSMPRGVSRCLHQWRQLENFKFFSSFGGGGWNFLIIFSKDLFVREIFEQKGDNGSRKRARKKLD